MGPGERVRERISISSHCLFHQYSGISIRILISFTLSSNAFFVLYTVFRLLFSVGREHALIFCI